jgi:putative two-component system response regulator
MMRKCELQMMILVVDDDRAIVELIEHHIHTWGFTALTAANGLDAWAILEAEPIDLVICDWVIPGIDGLELCRKIRARNFERYVYFIIISGHHLKQNIVKGLEAGADDYVGKPIDFDELRARVGIGQRIVRLEKDRRERFERMEANFYQTISMFGQLLEIFDEELGGHARRVANFSLALAKRHPDVSTDDYPIAEAAGLLHDIGMLGLPSEILAKKRTEMKGDEQKLYQSHPVQGEQILKPIAFLRPVAGLIRSHHEQYNGRGFPDGLAGDQIPLLAQIVAAASIYDNLVTKGKITFDEIPARLQQMKGYQLAPGLVDHLLALNLEILQQEGRKEFRDVTLDELREGMILAQSVCKKSGAILMPAQTELTAYGIEKLKNYYQVDIIGHKVSIYQYSVKD